MNTKKNIDYTNLERDLFFIICSIIFAILLVRLGAIHNLVSIVEEAKIIGSFLAGLFFTSVFTIAPASIALVEIAKNTSVFLVALFGSLGAVIGDLVIFLFVRDRFADDIMEVVGHIKNRKIKHFFKQGFFRWITPVVGALIIASPLPDEIGLTMLGVSKMKTWKLILISFVMNFIGILLVCFVAGVI